MISTMCVRAHAAGMIAQWNAYGKPADERWAETLAHFRSRMSNMSVCRLSCQYVNLHIIYLFQPRPARNSSKYYFFHAIHLTRGLSMVSAVMTANRASLLVLTLLVSSLLVSKHCLWAPAVRGIPSHNWWRGSLHVYNGYVIAIPPKFLACQTFRRGVWERPRQKKTLQIASMSHYKTTSRRQLFKII